MALVDNWVDLQDGIDDASAEPINLLATNLIQSQKDITTLKENAENNKKGRNQIVISPYSEKEEYTSRADYILSGTDGSGNAKTISEVVRGLSDAGGGEIIFFNGVVPVASDIDIAKNIRINGNGTTFVDTRTSDEGLFFLGENTMITGINVKRESPTLDSGMPVFEIGIGAKNATLSDCYIDYSVGGGRPEDSTLIKINGKGATIRDCKINAFGGLMIDALEDSLTIHNCEISGTSAIIVTGDFFVASENRITTNVDYAIFTVHGGNSVISNNIFTSEADSINYEMPVILIESSDNIISNNHIIKKYSGIQEQALSIVGSNNFFIGNIAESIVASDGNTTYTTADDVSKAIDTAIGTALEGEY